MAERNHKTHQKWLCNILHGENPEVPDYSDLTGWWRSYPPEASDPKHPEYVELTEWLVGFMLLADFHHWARESRHQFHRKLLENGEPVPTILDGWVEDEIAQGKRGPDPGRPPKPDRDFLILMGYTRLLDEEITREKAIFLISDCLGIYSDTIGSIIYKHRDALPRRR